MIYEELDILFTSEGTDVEEIMDIESILKEAQNEIVSGNA